MSDQPRVYWKYEDGPDDAGLDPHPQDVGPAWLNYPDGRSEKVNEEWMTREAIRAYATANGYQLEEDG